MKLHYYRPSEESSNFGDELNKYIWEYYFPNFFDEDDQVVFFGIGTILRAAKKFYPTSKIIIFGSGAHAPSQKMEPNFKVDFLRGPLSAECLGLTNNHWITDPAIVIPDVFPNTNIQKEFRYSYMPHYSVANSTLKNIFESLGIHYIDPRGDVFAILKSIQKTEVLLTEAMHGAIVADAYRIPWIPIKSYSSFNEFKWKDWAMSLNMKPNIYKIFRFYEGEKGWKFLLKKWIVKRRIRSFCKLTPYLSDEGISKKAKDKLLKRINKFQEKYHIS